MPNQSNNNIPNHNDMNNNNIKQNKHSESELTCLNNSNDQPTFKPTEYVHSQFINVDDEPGIIKINQKLFEKLGQEINSCRCGSEL